MKFIEAKRIADRIIEVLSPYCEEGKCLIGGSIRREKPEVKDIEVICLPKTINVSHYNLFTYETIIERSPKFTQSVRVLGEIIKGKPDGKYMQILLPLDIKLDLFMPDDFDYWRQYVIRTGSAEWVMRYVAGGWRKLGFCGSDQGLRKMSDCEKIPTPDGKGRWKCINLNGERPPFFESEKHVFDWLGINYVKPKDRK